MSYRDHLILRAHNIWRKGEPLPMTLVSEMLAEGLDVDALERKYKEQYA